jgi:hypothetical protein
MRRVIYLMGVLGLVACTDSNGPHATLGGTYDLKTVNGAPLPYTASENATQKDEILGDAITASDGEFTQNTANRTTVNGHADDGISLDSGTYAIDGTIVTFTSLSGHSWTATISGNTLTTVFTVPAGGIGVYVLR